MKFTCKRDKRTYKRETKPFLCNWCRCDVKCIYGYTLYMHVLLYAWSTPSASLLLTPLALSRSLSLSRSLWLTEYKSTWAVFVDVRDRTTSKLVVACSSTLFLNEIYLLFFFIFIFDLLGDVWWSHCRSEICKVFWPFFKWSSFLPHTHKCWICLVYARRHEHLLGSYMYCTVQCTYNIFAVGQNDRNNSSSTFGKGISVSM